MPGSMIQWVNLPLSRALGFQSLWDLGAGLIQLKYNALNCRRTVSGSYLVSRVQWSDSSTVKVKTEAAVEG